MILKGQNFRVCVPGSESGTYKVIGMATNCTITLTNNVEEGTHKDVVGMASMPVTVSKAWSVSVDSLDVSDTAAILTAIKSMQPMTLFWNETQTTDNQTWSAAEYPRTGQAYLSDCTFQFDNRTNGTKSLQFTGASTLDLDSRAQADCEPVTPGSFTKGQFVRLFLSSDNTAAPVAVIAAARTLSLHVSLSMESATTKDTGGDYDIQEPTGISYDISTGALYKSNETITSSVGGKAYKDLESIYAIGTPVKWKIANTTGANNRTASSTICSGSAVLTSLQLNAPNRSDCEYTAQLNGYGELTVAA